MTPREFRKPVSRRRVPRPRSHAVRLAAAGLAVLLLAACEPQESTEQAAEPALTDDIARASYGIGYKVVDNVLGQQAGLIDEEAFRLGVDDALGDREARISDDALDTAMEALRVRSGELRDEEAQSNLEAGRAFLAENATREGVVTLESGLQYEVLEPGEGDSPALEDMVMTHYHGTRIDGSVFDSSIERGEPATFPVNGVIRGWVEALQLMKEGAKWRLFVPSELAYGARGAQGVIGPNEVLIFDIELLEVQPAET